MAAAQWTIYHNPRCSKSRQTLKILEEHDIAPTIVAYLDRAPSRKSIEDFITNSKLDAAHFVRRKEPAFKAYKDLDLTNVKAVAKALHECPQIMERPVVTKGKKCVIGRPPEEVLKLI